MTVCRCCTGEVFARRQADLVAFANTALGRWILRIDQYAPETVGQPIVAVWPNAIHVPAGPGLLKAVCFSRPVVAQRWHQRERLRRRQGTLYADLMLSTASREAHAFAVAETLTRNPDANPETTSVDGRVGRENGGTETWGNLRGGAGTTASDAGVNIIGTGYQCSTTLNGYSTLYRGVWLFDTSSLPDSAVISAAVFSLYGRSKVDNGSQSIGVVACTPASNTALVAADFGTFGGTRFASDLTITALSTAAYNDWTLNATGIAAMSLTGVSKFGTRLSGDIDNSAPAWVSLQEGYVIPWFADDASNLPKLVITYQMPGFLLLF